MALLEARGVTVAAGGLRSTNQRGQAGKSREPRTLRINCRTCLTGHRPLHLSLPPPVLTSFRCHTHCPCAAAGSPRNVFHEVKIHKLTADGPMPDELAVKFEFDDSSEVASTLKTEWRIFRLTLVSELADASRFADARSRPQGLPGVMLSAALASKVVRTFAVAVYDTEVTCLIIRFVLLMLHSSVKPSCCPELSCKLSGTRMRT